MNESWRSQWVTSCSEDFGKEQGRSEEVFGSTPNDLNLKCPVCSYKILPRTWQELFKEDSTKSNEAEWKAIGILGIECTGMHQSGQKQKS